MSSILAAGNHRVGAKWRSRLGRGGRVEGKEGSLEHVIGSEGVGNVGR